MRKNSSSYRNVLRFAGAVGLTVAIGVSAYAVNGGNNISEEVKAKDSQEIERTYKDGEWTVHEMKGGRVVKEKYSKGDAEKVSKEDIIGKGQRIESLGKYETSKSEYETPEIDDKLSYKFYTEKRYKEKELEALINKTDIGGKEYPKIEEYVGNVLVGKLGWTGDELGKVYLSKGNKVTYQINNEEGLTEEQTNNLMDTRDPRSHIKLPYTKYAKFILEVMNQSYHGDYNFNGKVFRDRTVVLKYEHRPNVTNKLEVKQDALHQIILNLARHEKFKDVYLIINDEIFYYNTNGIVYDEEQDKYKDVEGFSEKPYEKLTPVVPIL